MAKSSSVVITACNTCCLAVIFKGINFSSSKMPGHENQILSKHLESLAPSPPGRDSGGLSGTAQKFLGGQSLK